MGKNWGGSIFPLEQFAQMVMSWFTVGRESKTEVAFSNFASIPLNFINPNYTLTPILCSSTSRSVLNAMIFGLK